MIEEKKDTRVTVDQLTWAEYLLKRGDRTLIAKRLNIDKAFVSQVLRQKNVYLSRAYAIYLCAKDIIETRNDTVS